MTHYNSLNVKLSNSQLNKLKSAIKNDTDVILRLSSNTMGNSDDETNYPHKLLLTNRQVANIRKAFANHTSTNIKLSKAQLTNFEIQWYYQNEPRFKEVYSRDNLSDKIKDGAYVVNLDEYTNIGAHWIALYVNNKTVTYFNSFAIEHISKEV